MNQILIIFSFFALFFVLMSVGYIFRGKEIKGSCGGLGKLMGEDCEFCENKDKCTRKS